MGRGVAPKSIFIGSSVESSDQATLIAGIMETVPDAVPLIWMDAFPLGIMTFEGIESIARRAAGAILLFAPDDELIIRGEKLRVARSNVVLEWGFLTALLGRDRVIVCRYDDVSLPADLLGLTYCPMGPFRKEEPRSPILPEAEAKIRSWIKHLPAVALRSPVAMPLHGYSGLWSIRIIYKIWRGIAITGNDTAYFEGKLLLHLPRAGQRGVGSTYGKVFVSIAACRATFRLSDIQSDVKADPDGSIVMTGESYTRQLDKAIIGIPPQEDGFREELPAPNRFELILRPDPAGRLTGEHQTIRANQVMSAAEVVCERLTELS